VKFDLKKPCKDCPFIKGTTMKLRPGRMASITRDLRNDYVVFPCHKTTKHDDDGELVQREREQACMGALAYSRAHLPQLPVLARIAIARGETTLECIEANLDAIENPHQWSTTR
jgi:hypothetical protein